MYRVLLLTALLDTAGICGPGAVQQQLQTPPAPAEATWTDGRSCAAAGFDDCEGRRGEELALHPFPPADASDPYVGARYEFDAEGRYLYARREVIMAVRHALHGTNEVFPFDAPLGILDASQADGMTPGTDAGDPRHPASSHSQGGNIDLAYFQTSPDNRSRIVCGDGSVHEDGYCSDEAATLHTVDLRREAYFLAMLADFDDGNRLRVIGVDKVLAPPLAEELDRLAADGLITEKLRDRTKGRLASGDGWPYHHHHVHVSFHWWAAGGS
ncbi:MAG: hypothetical protein HY907_21350 [Deltaproteobacteria bacterium]|nr:hypothetical protein [Deltaproteobacteria bacterium]